MTEQTMTAEDAALVQGFHDGANIWLTKACLARILATYHALAASQRTAEVWRSKAEMYGKDATNARREADALRAQLAAAQADTKRLDWLETRSWIEADGGFLDAGEPPTHPQESGWLRAAIDAARGGDNG